MKTILRIFLSLFLLSIPVFSYGQWTITGQVSDTDDGQLLIGASVKLENSLKGSLSDKQGMFKIQSLKSGIYSLKISYVGYETYTQSIDLQKDTKINIRLKKSVFMADEVLISATRANEKSGMAFLNITEKELKKSNLGQDLPQLLNFTPSLVSTSDAGAGIGYTGMRIRGTDATRINVTINGIPFNDSESAGTYFVNIPDLSSSVSSVQIQRGVGTSTNGTGAFGATVNIQTNQFRKEAYTETNTTIGSYNTLKTNVLMGTGLINDKFTVDARLSKTTSDGYVDRATANLKSFYVSGAYFGKKSFARLNVFSGIERTYQAWEGVPQSLLASNRTFNVYTYPNQVDNYQQNHYQLLSSHSLSKYWTLNLNLHYTKGKGYYEQFKEAQKFSKYGLADVIIGNQTLKKTDLIRRKWLDNDFYGTTFSLDYDSFKSLKLNFGGAINQYDGKHFGEIIWAKYASNSDLGYHYYDNLGTKEELSFYTKAFYQIKDGLDAFVDVQFRHVAHNINGLNDDRSPFPLATGGSFNFLNPKVGLTYQLSVFGTAYSSFSVGNKEPNRDDFVNKLNNVSPQAETLQDLELGYKHQQGSVAFSANYYLMSYKNQLVVTGQLNDVGNPIRTNVPQSYRTGLELELGAMIGKYLKINTNATFSKNKIKNFTEIVPNYDGNPDQRNSLPNADIAYSPNVILGSQILYSAHKNLEIGLLSKYVGQQYLDNTTSDTRKLNAYFTNDIRILYSFRPKFIKEISLSFLANNIFSSLYESNGYTYSYVSENQRIDEVFYYPQAPRNFLLAVAIKF